MLLLLTLRSELQHANNQHSNPLTAKRILVYGVCGSGKTTFARRLSERTGIPWTSVDDMAWLPGWVNTTEEYQREQAERICAADEWILDTAYGKWIDIPLGRVELILALDYPRWFSLQRLLRRTFSRVIDKKPICNGNVESWRTMFSRDSIIVWHFKSWKRKRQRIRAWTASKDGPKVIAFANARGAERWLQSQQPVRRESRQPDERQP
jgi:adenylate kinase family enzyme